MELLELVSVVFFCATVESAVEVMPAGDYLKCNHAFVEMGMMFDYNADKFNQYLEDNMLEINARQYQLYNELVRTREFPL
jgi:hypothetical protein